MHIFSQHDGTGAPHYAGLNACLHTTHTTCPRGLPHLQSVYQLGSPLEPEFKEHFAGGDLESDLDYRFRYSNTIPSPPTDCACTSVTRQRARFSHSNTLLPPSSQTTSRTLHRTTSNSVHGDPHDATVDNQGGLWETHNIAPSADGRGEC